MSSLMQAFPPLPSELNLPTGKIPKRPGYDTVILIDKQTGKFVSYIFQPNWTELILLYYKNLHHENISDQMILYNVRQQYPEQCDQMIYNTLIHQHF